MTEPDDALILEPIEEEFFGNLFEVMGEIRDLPCSGCGSIGDTYPCIRCDKLICGECGEGIRWCKEHAPTQQEMYG